MSGTSGGGGRLLVVTPWIAGGAVVLLAALFTLHHFVNFDVFWHVKTGRWILEQRQVPRTDPFGAMTGDMAWLDVAWASQAVAAWIVEVAGLAGLHLLCVALVAATLAALLRASPRTPLLLACALLFTLAAWLRFQVRPDLLILPLTMIALALSERLPRAPRSTLALVALLTAAWVNLHGSFIFVPIFLALGGAGALLERRGRSEVRTFAVATLLSLAAAAANPYGFRVYGLLRPYAASILAAVGLASPAADLGVMEWRATWREIFIGPVFPTVAFLLLIAGLAVSFLLWERRPPVARMLWAAALLALGLAAVRNLLPFGAGALWIVAANERDRLAELEEAGRRRPRPRFELAASVLVAVVALAYAHAAVTDRFYVRRGVPNRTGLGPDLALLPEGIVGWLAAHRPPGRLFNNYDSGAWILYRLFPEVRTYLDSRLDVTPYHREVRAALGNPAAFMAIVERDGLGTLALLHPSPESALLPWLRQDPRWTLAFRDANTTVHVRSGSFPPRPRRPPLALADPRRPWARAVNGWLDGLKTHRLPAAELTDAFVSGLLGDRARQAEAARRALTLAPGNRRAREYLQAASRPGR